MKLKDSVKGVLGVILFYLIIILGVIMVNARLEQIKNVEAEATTLVNVPTN